jgi:hypothetical protein
MKREGNLMEALISLHLERQKTSTGPTTNVGFRSRAKVQKRRKK